MRLYTPAITTQRYKLIKKNHSFYGQEIVIVPFLPNFAAVLQQRCKTASRTSL